MSRVSTPRSVLPTIGAPYVADGWVYLPHDVLRDGVVMAVLSMRVKTGTLSGVGQELLSAANAIPDAPQPVAPACADPLATAIAAHVTSTVAPLVADRPAVKDEASSYAQALGAAARAYVGTDQPLGDQIDRQLSGIPASG